MKNHRLCQRGQKVHNYPPLKSIGDVLDHQTSVKLLELEQMDMLGEFLPLRKTGNFHVILFFFQFHQAFLEKGSFLKGKNHALQRAKSFPF